MKGVLLSLALVVCVMAVVSSKHCKKHRHEGCRLFKGRCTCEVVRGCHNPFPYNTEKECLDDAKGQCVMCERGWGREVGGLRECPGVCGHSLTGMYEGQPRSRTFDPVVAEVKTGAGKGAPGDLCNHGLNDQCAGHPCDNGVCVQVKHGRGRGWYCECAGTGFYGKQCQHQCPKGLDPMDPRSYPTACVMTDGINSGLGL